MKKLLIMVMLLGVNLIQASMSALQNNQNQNLIVEKTDKSIQKEDISVQAYFEACRTGNLDKVKKCIESNKFDPNIACSKFNLTGVCRAALFGKKEVYLYLIKLGCKSDYQCVDNSQIDSEEF